MPKGSGAESAEADRARRWMGYTPGGERLLVEREHEAWVVTCDQGDPVRHRLLDLALIEAIRGQTRGRSAIEPGEWARLIADSILTTWPAPDAT